MDLKREIRLADLSPQARIAVVVVLAAAALALATFMLVHARGTSSSDSATPVAKPVVRAPHRPVAARSALPANVSGALHAGSAVVVALYAPNVELDALSLEEAQAGAAKAGATFTTVDVTTSDVNGLAARYAVVHDPTVLVLKPSGDLAVKLDGFADKETVAQAAASAAR